MTHAFLPYEPDASDPTRWQIRYCDVCEENYLEAPTMILARWHDQDICTDCLSNRPGVEEEEEAVALCVERYWPITRCQYCHCRTQTAQDPQGPDGGCARCLYAINP